MVEPEKVQHCGESVGEGLWDKELEAQSKTMVRTLRKGLSWQFFFHLLGNCEYTFLPFVFFTFNMSLIISVCSLLTLRVKR